MLKESEKREKRNHRVHALVVDNSLFCRGKAEITRVALQVF